MTALIVALVVIGASLVIAEAHVPSYGLLGLSGIAAFAVAGVLAVGAAGGSALLAFALVVPAAAVGGGLIAVAAGKTLAVRRRRPRAGPEGLIGRIGVVHNGDVLVQGERWRARRLDSRRRTGPARGRSGRRRADPGPDAVRAPGRGMGGAVMVTAVLFAVVVVLAIIAIAAGASIRILREYERAVVFRLGRLLGVKGPGLVLLIPFIDRMQRVDLRTVTLDIPPQTVITRDNVPAKVNAVCYFRVIDAGRAIIGVEQFLAATTQIAQTTLRSVLGKADLDMLLSEREQLNEALQHMVDEHTDPWGIKVTTVEIKDVEIPTAMQHAMALGAQAERERRAKIIHAEGEFQASQRLRDAADVIAGNPAVAAAALPADADRDRRDAELDGRVPAPAGHDEAVRRGGSGVRPARGQPVRGDGDDLQLTVAELDAPGAQRRPGRGRGLGAVGRRGAVDRAEPSGLQLEARGARAREESRSPRAGRPARRRCPPRASASSAGTAPAGGRTRRKRTPAPCARTRALNRVGSRQASDQGGWAWRTHHGGIAQRAKYTACCSIPIPTTRRTARRSRTSPTSSRRAVRGGRPAGADDQRRRARGLQDGAAEHLRRAGQEPDPHPQRGLREGERGRDQGPGRLQAAARRHEDPVQARDEGRLRRQLERHHAHQDGQELVQLQRRGQGELERRRRPVARPPLPEHVGVQPRRRPARLRAVPGRPVAEGRRGHPPLRVRRHRHRDRPVQPRPHGDPRGRPLARTCSTSGATTGRAAAARTTAPTRPTRRARTTASRRSRTSRATTGRTATCSWTTWTTSTTTRW